MAFGFCLGTCAAQEPAARPPAAHGAPGFRDDPPDRGHPNAVAAHDLAQLRAGEPQLEKHELTLSLVTKGPPIPTGNSALFFWGGVRFLF